VTGLTARSTLAAEVIGKPTLNFTIFAFFVVVTLVIAVSVARKNNSATDYYAGGRTFTGFQNGVATGGDYLGAATFLGTPGIIAIYGFDGILYSVGFLVGWVLVLLLVSEPFRNTGRYTMADVLDLRLRARSVRAAAALSTLMISLFYLLAQMAGAGVLVSLLLGVNSSVGEDAVIAVVGILMIVYVLVGGMKGTTWVQIIKATILVVTAAVATVWLLVRTGFSIPVLLHHAVASSPSGKAVLSPGLEYGVNTVSKFDFISLALALVLGTAGLPHVLMRLYTVPNAREARRGVTWTIWLVGAVYLCTFVLGFGAMWLVGDKNILAAPGGSNSAVPLLADKLGGPLLFGIIAAVAFATILAFVAGVTITASASFAHDVYAGLLRHGEAEPADEVRVARISALVVGILGAMGGIAAKGINVAFLVGLAFAIAAAANLPSILYSLFWPRFTTRGALWSIYGGLISSVVLIIFSPVFSGQRKPLGGASSSLITNPHINFAFFPLNNPAIVAIPLAFFLGWLGTVTDRQPADSARFARMQVRALTGMGAERGGPS
jgi:cation/acetate symporter